MTTSSKIDPGKFRTVFVLLLLLAVAAIFLAVIWPFLKALLLGALLAGLFNPLYRWFVRLFKGRKALASVCTLLILFILVVGPLSALLGLVVQQAIEVSDQAIPWLQQRFGEASALDFRRWLVLRFPFLGDFIPSQREIVNSLGTITKAAGSFLVSSASAFTAGTAGFFLNFFVMIYAMFFFLKDGHAILDRIFLYIPLHHEDEMLMLERFVSVTRATIKGTLLIGLIQGTLGGLAFSVAGINGAAFWGAVMVVFSIIPGIGTALIWIPAVIYLFIVGLPMNGTLLALWCVGVVGTIDNVLRPTLVGKDAQMPDLLILVGTLGGLILFGPIGLIIGPVICGLFLTALEIYSSTFKKQLPPVKGIAADGSAESSPEKETDKESKEDESKSAKPQTSKKQEEKK